MTNPRYLGDGVYAHVAEDTGSIVLTTGHHDPQSADAVIYLEREVAEAVVKYITQNLVK